MPPLPSNFNVPSLAALVPLPSSRSPPHPPRIHDLLRELLSPLRHAWLSDFLFSPTVSHFPYFTEDNISKHALLTHLTTVRVQPTHEDDQDTCFLAANLLYVPAVTVQRLTAGFGVIDANYTLGPSALADTPTPHTTSLCTHFRFARDAANDTLLELYDLPSQQSILLSYARTESPTTARTFKARFHRQAFLATVRAQPQYTVSYFDSLANALQWFQIELQRRQCGSCQGLCVCQRRVVRASNAFDHAQFATGMIWNMGSFVGIANKVRYQGGMPSKYTKLGSKSVAMFVEQGEGRNEIVRALVAWANAEDPSHADDDGQPEQRVVSRMPSLPQLPPGQALVDAVATRVSQFGDLDANAVFPASTGTDTSIFGSPPPPQQQQQQQQRSPPQWTHGLSEKEVKAEIRKQRNRESALRSNRKKKAIMDALKEETERLKETAEQLMARETELREENLSLRRMFISRWE